MTSVTIIFTCHNRIKKTRCCLETIEDERLDLSYIIVDDGSIDGTGEMIEAFLKAKDRHYMLIKGDGNLFWAGGMRKGMGYYLENDNDTDYVVLVNDDVSFKPDALRYMIEQSGRKNEAVIVGTISDLDGCLSYGGVKFRKGGLKYDSIPMEKADEIQCDTFNCNCVLIKNEVFRIAGSFDSHYTHAMADFDYGFRLKRLGISVYETDKIIGTCETNKKSGTWRDTSLSRIERIKKKENPKGLPKNEWFYYLRKNFGIINALWYSITPYIRIMIGI